MKKYVAFPVIVALTLGALTACVPDPTVGSGIPALISQNESVELVNAIQPDAVGGTEGVIYVVTLDSKLNTKKLSAVAAQITNDLAENSSPEENWGIKFRSGNREIGMSESAYISDYPKFAPKPTLDHTATPAPTPEPTEPPVLSYDEQLVVINGLFAVEGTKFVKTYDGLLGYVDVTFDTTDRYEEYYEAVTPLLDESGWKNRGDFYVQLNTSNPTNNSVIKLDGNSVRISANPSLKQTEGLSKLLVFPATPVAMLRAVNAVEGLGLISVAVEGRNQGQEITIEVDGALDTEKSAAITGAMATVAAPDAQYVRKVVNYSR